MNTQTQLVNEQLEVIKQALITISKIENLHEADSSKQLTMVMHVEEAEENKCKSHFFMFGDNSLFQSALFENMQKDKRFAVAVCEVVQQYIELKKSSALFDLLDKIFGPDKTQEDQTKQQPS